MTGFSSDLLNGKTIMVTGAGKGLGLACAEALVAGGAKVLAVARTEADLQSLTDRFPGRVEPWVADVTSPDFLARLAAVPTLHGLLNNAGTNRVGSMLEQSEEDLDAVVNLNVRAPWLVSRAALPALIQAAPASIVNMSSQMGHVGSSGRTLYCMSKHAVEGLTKAMAVEFAELGVRVNTVAPTFVLTPLTRPMLDDPAFAEFVMGRIPMNKLATEEAVAAACVYLLSDLSASTTGSCLKVDGGWTAQ